MSDRTGIDALAHAVGGLVRPHQVGDVLERLTLDCAEEMEADAAAILVLDDHERLTLLSATTAAATYLEMLQAQESVGPCVDVVSTGAAVAVGGEAELRTRWKEVGVAIVDAGFLAVAGYPMVWHGRVIGGLNVFYRRAEGGDAARRALGQVFADVATVALVHSDDVTAQQIAARVRDAALARGQVEQAKGALAHLEDLDIERAHRRLHELAQASGRSISETARDVLVQLLRTSPRRP